VSNRKEDRKQKLLSKQVPRIIPRGESTRTNKPSNSGVPLAPASHELDPFGTLPVDGRANAQFYLSKCKLSEIFWMSVYSIDRSAETGSSLYHVVPHAAPILAD
jgi:hypothetical protein